MLKEFNHTMVNRRAIVKWILVLACMMTNISQISFFVNTGLSSKVSTVIWAALGAVSLLLSGMKIIIKRLYVFWLSALFLLFLGLNSIIYNLNYWSSTHIYSLFISLFVFLIGCILTRIMDKDFFRYLIWGYVISACIVALEVYVRYFANGFNISSRIYVYDSKNSLAQILLTAIVLLLFGISAEEKRRHKLIIAIIIIGLFFLICIMKSRASLVGFIIIYVVFLSNRKIKRRYKILYIIGVLTFFVILFNNNALYKLLVNDILFAGRNARNIDDLTSGRVVLLSRAFQSISVHLFEGIGSKYLDCFPIAVIMQFGLLPGLILCVIAACPFIFAIKHIHDFKYNYSMVLVLLTVSSTYLVNGLFEALTPLGPGVKCYFLWLLYGVLKNQNTDSYCAKRLVGESYESSGDC